MKGGRCEGTALDGPHQRRWFAGKHRLVNARPATRLTRARSESISAGAQYRPSATTPAIDRVFAMSSSGFARRITRSAT
jgi:hypothetical protein